MKLLLLLFTGLFFASPPGWEVDFAKARQTANTEHKLILVNFSGSDWCGPCIRMESEIFGSPAFSDYAKDHLVLVNADFPRLKKHALSKEQEKKNEQLADVYNAQGIFPLTVLLAADGKVLKTWEGLPPLSGDEFTAQIKATADAVK
ncbi:MAG: thioredoxin family protein [Flavobacterium sp.]